MKRGALIAVAWLAACNSQWWPDPPVIHHPDGACVDAETHLRAIGCDKEAATGGGFGAFCEREAKRAVDFHPTCVARITTCAQFNGSSRGEGC